MAKIRLGSSGRWASMAAAMNCSVKASNSKGFFLTSCIPAFLSSFKNWCPGRSSDDRSDTSELAIDQPAGSFRPDAFAWLVRQ